MGRVLYPTGLGASGLGGEGGKAAGDFRISLSRPTRVVGRGGGREESSPPLMAGNGVYTLPPPSNGWRAEEASVPWLSRGEGSQGRQAVMRCDTCGVCGARLRGFGPPFSQRA